MTQTQEALRAGLACALTLASLSCARHIPERLQAVDLRLGPISTYQESCARCHGPEGVFFAGQFTHTDRPSLDAITKSMMQDHCDTAPTPAEVDAMTDYMAAIQAGLPFAVVTNGGALLRGDANAVEGEASPGAAVELRKGKKSYPAAMNGFTWGVQHSLQPPFEIVVRRGEKVNTLHLTKRLSAKQSPFSLFLSLSYTI